MGHMTSFDARAVVLPSGERVPALGQGTWQMAEDPLRKNEEIAALRSGIELGMTLIDTAEMYSNGKAEELVGEAIAGRRDEVFVVSKVLPWNATRRGTISACERSLRRLRTDRLDLYLLHWPGRVPFDETLEAFQELQRTELIRYWGVSNLGYAGMEVLVKMRGGSEVTTDQVLYNLLARGIEYDLLPWSRGRGVPIMAYAPVAQGRLMRHAELTAVARGHGATPAQVALAWTIRQPGLITIPKASSSEHVVENRRALDLTLSDEDLARLDRAFPPPTGPEPPDMR
jgi:diketogulonate reductase-like aldo/keto reductase